MWLFHRLRANLSLFLVTITLLTTISSVFGQTFNHHFCSNKSYNDTANIKTLLGSLSSKAAQNNSFYKDTSNNLYGLYQCRGDVATDMCQKCVEAAIQEIQQPYRCQSKSRADIWYDECTLRYAPVNFFGTVKLDPLVLMYNARNASSPNNTYVDTLSLMNRLASEAGKEPMMYYAHDELPATAGDVAPKNVSATVQCCKDISGDDCNRCLQNLAMYAETCCLEKSGWRILAPSCNMRYEEYRFLTPSAPPPVPPPAPTTTSKGGNYSILPEHHVSILQTNHQSISPMLSPHLQHKSWDLVSLHQSKHNGGSHVHLDNHQSKGKNDNTTLTIIIVVVSSIPSMMIFIVCICILLRKRKQRKSRQQVEIVEEISVVESLQYNFDAISVATNNFSDVNKLGQGGFGAVYRGRLPNGQEIAVKRLSRDSEQGELEFKNEIMLVAKLQHRNLVRLVGFCLEGTERLLIYEYVPNSSLDHFIFDAINRACLDWDRRYNIIAGIARGLLYLHEDSRLRIIHRDLKASNVLLDAEMNPKISDFGLARLFVLDETQGNTSRIVGTHGYMAPEYRIHGQFSVKSDVFSFGVLILEIVSGQKNNRFRNGENEENLLCYAWKSLREGIASNIIDPTLRDGSGSEREMIRCIHIGLLCVQENVAARPTMAEVVLMLNSFSLTLSPPSEPAFFVRNSIGPELPLPQEYNSSASESSQSKSKSTLVSVNEASITELYPR
ncbi:cysteine-rich receptor-like protein kinase 10 [Camellia sinensis]|uniref:Uncharacterized protein n=1 Tax=Camellia sinensis var. sinensis TaxID=542762 RepID=A0A4S4DSA0_CAMSN|nr:cysteine-rich receptor-like protein kinase 10 [Camellia sinensis]THG05724.1 hypothetical protein TEA_021132 [Camellia sinensis var. sinensis]